MEVYELWVQIGCNFEMYKNKRALQVIDLQGGVPEDQLRQAARLAVCKINIDSDLRLAMTGTIRKYLAEHPAEFDPRKYLGPARENIKQLVKHKIVDVLGCDGKA